jgi:hypothetical protein
MTEGKRYWTNAETAAFLAWQPQTLRQKRHRGDGPPYHRMGDSPKARTAYDPDEVAAWLAARKFTSTSEETVRMADEEDAAVSSSGSGALRRSRHGKARSLNRAIPPKCAECSADDANGRPDDGILACPSHPLQSQSRNRQARRNQRSALARDLHLPKTACTNPPRSRTGTSGENQGDPGSRTV